MWGKHVLKGDEKYGMNQRFFITIDFVESAWEGNLSIGQHSYFWSDADSGDARLLFTGPCATCKTPLPCSKSGCRSCSPLFWAHFPDHHRHRW